MNRVIQIANLDETKRTFTNPQCGRVYYVKGISPTLNTCGGGRQTTQIFSDMQTKVNTPPHRLRYALGRTNKPNEWSGKSGTANFHANPVFACVTSTQWSNRGALIVEIK